MKTKKHITLSLAVLLLLLALLSACNADASAGLFRQIADSQAPIGIVYRQLLGINSVLPAIPSKVFYETDEGLFSSTGTVREKLKAGTVGNLIQHAFYDKTNNYFLYMTNDGTKTVKMFDITTKTDLSAITPSDPALSSLRFSRIYPNGIALIQGINSTNIQEYSILKYNTSTMVFDVTTHKLPSDTSNYDMVSVHMLTGRTNDPVSASAPVIISLVRNDGSDSHYRHFYYDGTVNPVELPSSSFGTIRFAGFAVSNTKLYLLSVDGQLFGGTVNGLFTEMIDISDTYSESSFIYAVSSTATGNTHIITKPTAKNSFLVLTFSNGATSTSVSSESIKEGYAESLFATDIVSALYIGSGASSDTLLVATNDNGMYKISINYANANADSSSNGTSSKSEEYDFTPVP